MFAHARRHVPYSFAFLSDEDFTTVSRLFLKYSPTGADIGTVHDVFASIADASIQGGNIPASNICRMLAGDPYMMMYIPASQKNAEDLKEGEYGATAQANVFNYLLNQGLDPWYVQDPNTNDMYIVCTMNGDEFKALDDEGLLDKFNMGSGYHVSIRTDKADYRITEKWTDKQSFMADTLRLPNIWQAKVSKKERKKWMDYAAQAEIKEKAEEKEQRQKEEREI